MVRTAVAAPGIWPHTNVLTGHARLVRNFLAITTGPVAARNLLVRAKHRGIITREEGSRSTRIGAQLKTATIFFFSAYHRSQRKEEEWYPRTA